MDAELAITEAGKRRSPLLGLALLADRPLTDSRLRLDLSANARTTAIEIAVAAAFVAMAASALRLR